MEHDGTVNDDKKRLISLAEASKTYGLTQRYLSKLAKRGRLQARKIGSIWLTTPKDVEAYIISRQKRGVYRDDIQL